MQGTCVKITSEYILNTSIYTLLYLLLILKKVLNFHLQTPDFMFYLHVFRNVILIS